MCILMMVIIWIQQALKDWEDRLRAAIKEGQEGSMTILCTIDDWFDLDLIYIWSRVETEGEGISAKGENGEKLSTLYRSCTNKHVQYIFIQNGENL